MSNLPEKLPQLKKDCASFLKANGLKPTTKTGAKAVHAFYYGALCVLNDKTNPYITLCLLSGRYSELCDFSEIQQ